MKLYHVSYIKNRESILSEGLKPMSSNDFKYDNRICFSLSTKRLGYDYVDFSDVDVYEVEIPDELIHLIKDDENLTENERKYHVCMDFPNSNFRLTNLKIIISRD